MIENGLEVVGIYWFDRLHLMGRAVVLSVVTWCAIWLVPMAALGGEIAEAEPNDSPAQANVLAPGQFGLGVITFDIGGNFPSNDDWWRSSAAVGDLVFAYVDTHESTAFKRTSLDVVSNDGATTLESDSGDGPPAGGVDSSAVVAGAAVTQSGNVYCRVGGPPGNPTLNSTPISPYRLYQAIVKPAETAAEQEANNTVATANAITARMMTGTVTGADLDFFKVYVRAGERLVVIMDDNPDDNGTFTDTELSILGPDGTTTLATGDNVGDNFFTGDGNAAGAIVALTAGIYYIRVAHGGEAAALDTDFRFVVLVDEATAPLDRDTDGAADSVNNCPDSANPDQADADGDGKGDVCDNCPAIFNADQADVDADGVGDACEPAPPPADAACGACAPGVLTSMLLSLSLMMWGRLYRKCAND